MYLPLSLGLFHWHWGNRMIAPVPHEVTLKDRCKIDSYKTTMNIK